MKTQSQINKRLRDYKNGVVDSPYRVKRWTSYDASFGAMEPGCIDKDRAYHAQCMDLAIDYVMWLTDNQTEMWGDAKSSIINKFPKGWKIVENKPSTIPQKGWIAVYTAGTYSRYGHIGIVYDGGNTNSFQILEQNWNGWANKKPSLRWDNYYGLTHFIVPPVAKEIEEPKKDVKSAPKQSIKKSSSIKVNMHHIKERS